VSGLRVSPQEKKTMKKTLLSIALAVAFLASQSTALAKSHSKHHKHNANMKKPAATSVKK
jgi:hypothetical protein